MEAILISIERLPDNLKSRYKELAVFHDDVGIPQKVRNLLVNTLVLMLNILQAYW